MTGIVKRSLACTLPLLLLGMAGCGGEAADGGRAVGEEEPRAGGPDPAGTEAPAASASAAPPGGLERWIADIREGLDGLPGALHDDPDGAERRVTSLYLDRQEHIERHYGPGGTLDPDEALAGAVREAEARFHDLMRLVGSTPADSVRVAQATERLESQLEVVLERARAADVPLTPAGSASDPEEPAGAAGAGAAGAAGEEAAARGLPEWLGTLREGLAEVERAAEAGRAAEARRHAVALYLDHYEPVEAYYGAGAPHASPRLTDRVAAGEAAFHALMQAEGARVGPLAAALRDELEGIRRAADRAGVPLHPRRGATDPTLLAGAGSDATADPGELDPRNPEVAAIVEDLREAEAAWAAGDPTRALERIEHAYLEGFETLEPRLPAPTVRRTERLFHLELRPRVSRGAPDAEVEAVFSALYGELAAADDALAAGTGFWFGAFNAFMIILREGLEAALLIAALLAYLGRVSDDPRHRRQVYAGLGLGIAASLGTWVVARTLIPVGGGSRELIEGITALLAVGVLVYVSHWLFHKTYVHDWKEYLTERVGKAVSTGSSLAMALLAFAAVYREGFETVLFYQALLFDVGGGALLAGFLPGLVLILGIGVGIVRLGLRLPIRKVFTATNAVLLYLAFVFLGKGLYNLQEAGLFSPHPAPWVPDHEALRQLLGLYPVAETVAAQAAFLALLGGTWVFYRRRARPPAGPPDGERGSRKAGREATGMAGMAPATRER